MAGEGPATKFSIDSGKWRKMPRLMLSKCATMQALRAGWPDQFGALYAEEELDRAKVEDRAASEIVEREREEQRLRAIAGKDSHHRLLGRLGA